jgi:hypothetical protein
VREVVDSLRIGTLGVLDALDQPRCWLCDLSAAGEVVGCLEVDFDDIPRDALPAPGTMLRPSLEPIPMLRSLGPDGARR